MGKWVKLPFSLGDGLKTGEITRDEFMLLSYMLTQCDLDTGEIVTNSRLLSLELHADRKWVSNILSSLKKKGRISSLATSQTELRQKRGSTKPYAIYLCDSMPLSGLDRAKTEARQRLDRESAEKAAGSAETLPSAVVGTDVALKDLDLDQREQQQHVVDTSFTEEDVTRLTEMYQVHVRTPSKKDVPFIAELLEKYGVARVTNGLEVMDETPNIDNPPGFLRDACKDKGYSLSDKTVATKEQEARRKAKVIADKEADELKQRAVAEREADAAKMGELKATMSPQYLEALRSRAISSFPGGSGKKLPEQALILREDEIIKQEMLTT